MYLICYCRTNPSLDETFIKVAKAVNTVDEITEFMNAHRGEQEYFVLTAVVYPEKR